MSFDRQWDYIGAVIPNPDPLPLGNMTDAEVFKLTGTLPPDRIERLIDIAGRIDPDALDPACLDDAKGSYPEEGFLQFAVDELRKMGKMTPAQLKDLGPEVFTEIAEELDVLQGELTAAAECGVSVIDDYQKEVGKL